VGAIVWDLITWYFGLPTSSSHALIGGYAGAAVAKAGWTAVVPTGWTKTILFTFLSPCIGLGAWPPADDAHLLDLPVGAPVAGRSVVQTAPAALGGFLQPQPRRQRRAEDDGDHRRRPVCGGVHSEIRHSILGGARGAYIDRASAPSP